MDRQPSTQDVTWIIDLNSRGKLDLDPPYQRKSVWTKKDKQFFIDTVIRNYPSPAIFLHKELSDDGTVIYHVVDGKQRIQTILDFIDDRFSINEEYGDNRLDSKKWSEIDSEFKKRIWNYRLSVEQIDIDVSKDVNEIFERLNRNSRKLSRQELRHAKFDGWLAGFVDNELSDEFWNEMGLSTAARSKRMSDAQFISELIITTIEGRLVGFSQDFLDKAYANYDNPTEEGIDFSEDDFKHKFHKIKDLICKINEFNMCVQNYAKGVLNFYSLWTFLMLDCMNKDHHQVAEFYAKFMNKVSDLKDEDSVGTMAGTNHYNYFIHMKGANTDKMPREKRYQALSGEFLNESS